MDADIILCTLACNLPTDFGVSAEFTEKGLVITNPSDGKKYLVNVKEIK